MCLAIPGKVISNEKGMLKVAYPGNIVNKALVGGLTVEVGDIVLVQMGAVIKKLSEQEYQQSLSAWDEALGEK